MFNASLRFGISADYRPKPCFVSRLQGPGWASRRGGNAPSMNRTCNPLLRKEMLYPIELWGLVTLIPFQFIEARPNTWGVGAKPSTHRLCPINIGSARTHRDLSAFPARSGTLVRSRTRAWPLFRQCFPPVSRPPRRSPPSPKGRRR